MTTEEKIFGLFFERCRSGFSRGRRWKDSQSRWERHLKSLGCKVLNSKDHDVPSSTRGTVYIQDPFWADSYNILTYISEEGFDVIRCISIPREVAEKALVLGFIP
jgi:hypothetical protein